MMNPTAITGSKYVLAEWQNDLTARWHKYVQQKDICEQTSYKDRGQLYTYRTRERPDDHNEVDMHTSEDIHEDASCNDRTQDYTNNCICNYISKCTHSTHANTATIEYIISHF